MLPLTESRKFCLKVSLRSTRLKNLAQDLPIPSSPVLKRWGTWLDAERYYAEHLEFIHTNVYCFDYKDAESIR